MRTVDFVKVKPYSATRQTLIDFVDALIGMLAIVAVVTLSSGILYLLSQYGILLVVIHRYNEYDNFTYISKEILRGYVETKNP